MKVEIRDMCKPSDEQLPLYFQILPSISVVKQYDKFHLYLSWFNILIHIK
jgi:hypothetical protein